MAEQEPSGAPTVQEVLKRALWRLAAATVVVYISLAGLGIYVYVTENSQQAVIARVTQETTETARETTDALCALRHDLELRVENSQQFLRDNPQGIPGISPAVIKQGISNQQDTIEALSPLDCR